MALQLCVCNNRWKSLEGKKKVDQSLSRTTGPLLLAAEPKWAVEAARDFASGPRQFFEYFSKWDDFI
jgi:hypothetical protein